MTAARWHWPTWVQFAPTDEAKTMYEFRIDGRLVGVYQDVEAALARVRLLASISPDAEAEVVDARTGRAFEIAASLRWREELAAKMR